jgi:hypothetical protein
MPSQKASTYFHELRLRNAASSWNKIEDDGLVAAVLSHLLPFLLSNSHHEQYHPYPKQWSNLSPNPAAEIMLKWRI